MKKKKLAILGGGLTGLTLSNLLKDKYIVSTFEKDTVSGGLCRTFRYNGFTFDIGGHIIFSKDKEVLNFIINAIGKKNLYKKPGNDGIFYKNKLINYPFETDLAKLGKKEAFECLNDFILNKIKHPKNFHQWLHFAFGKALAEKYLVPYNRKIWKTEPKDLDMDWVARIPKPTMEEMIKSCMGIPFEVKFARKHFFYPKKNGIQALTDALARNLKDLRLNSEIKKLKRTKNKWTLTYNETEENFDEVISTIPIFNLINILGYVPEKIRQAVAKLRYNSIMIACLGIKNKNILKKTAIYFPDKNFLPHRVCFMNNFSQNNAPRDKNAIICEITFNPKSDLSKKTDTEVLNNVLSGLEKNKIINKSQIEFKKLLRFPYAYVVYDKNYNKNIKVIYNWLRLKKIHTIGRFAEFQYLNMDACVRHAMDFVKTNKL